MIASSSAPLAPSAWPCSALVPLIATWRVRGEHLANSVDLGRVADRGRAGVSVQIVDLVGPQPASVNANCIARADWPPPGRGAIML